MSFIGAKYFWFDGLKSYSILISKYSHPAFALGGSLILSP